MEHLLAPEPRSYLALGAQGPDIFYHNRRREPSGLVYGTLMHTRGYGEAVSRMAEWAWTQATADCSWAPAWIIGFVSHAILDRHTHPYIDHFSGWVDRSDPVTERFRSMHPFLERLIDVAMLEASRGVHPNEFDFYRIVNIGETPPPDWLTMVGSALRETYGEAEEDAELRERITNAYLDTMGYYQTTNAVDEEFLCDKIDSQEWRENRIPWLSIVHPLEVPASIDVLNTNHAVWTHPCDADEKHSESFTDLFEAAFAECVSTAREIVDLWGSPERSIESRRERVERIVGNWNLNDGRRSTKPCEKRHAAPLPLPELQEQIRDALRTGRESDF